MKDFLRHALATLAYRGGKVMRDAPEGTVHGLTTAASLWATTALGVACALGVWRIVLVTFVLVIVVLVLGGPIEKGVEALVKRNRPNS